jgi:hypothetical protein
MGLGGGIDAIAALIFFSPKSHYHDLQGILQTVFG